MECFLHPYDGSPNLIELRLSSPNGQRSTKFQCFPYGKSGDWSAEVIFLCKIAKKDSTLTCLFDEMMMYIQVKK